MRADAWHLSRFGRSTVTSSREGSLKVRGLRSAALGLALVVGLVASGGGGGRAFAADGCPEPNDSAEQACELKLDREIEDELANSGDADRFRIDVKDGQNVLVTAKTSRGMQKLRIEGSDGKPIVEVGLGQGKREVLAERLPEGRYTVYLSGEGGDPGTSYPYTIGWKAVGSGAAVPTETPRGQLRNLVLPAVEAGDYAFQTSGRLLVTDVGRVYEAVYERENTIVARKHGPMYLLDRVHVAESAEKAQSVFNAWDVFDLPEANDARPYGSLGDQPIPGLGDDAHALGACFKCDDDNPLRSYRIVARFDNVVHVLYAWGRDAGTNTDTLVYLANKLPKRLGSTRGPAAPLALFDL